MARSGLLDLGLERTRARHSLVSAVMPVCVLHVPVSVACVRRLRVQGSCRVGRLPVGMLVCRMRRWACGSVPSPAPPASCALMAQRGGATRHVSSLGISRDTSNMARLRVAWQVCVACAPVRAQPDGESRRASLHGVGQGLAVHCHLTPETVICHRGCCCCLAVPALRVGLGAVLTCLSVPDGHAQGEAPVPHVPAVPPAHPRRVR